MDGADGRLAPHGAQVTVRVFRPLADSVVVRYAARVGPWLLPYLWDRGVLMHRRAHQRVELAELIPPRRRTGGQRRPEQLLQAAEEALLRDTLADLDRVLELIVKRGRALV